MSDQTYLAVQKLLSSEFDLSSLSDTDDFENHLAARINDLISFNFSRLVNILYRIDIDESKLKEILQAYPAQNAGLIIGRLIINRLLQKIKIREEFRDDTTIDEEEKW